MSRPRFAGGLSLALRRPGLVAAVWLVPVAVGLPLLLAAGGGPEAAPLDTDEASLVLRLHFQEIAPTLALPTVAAMLATWVWTLWWQAGLVARPRRRPLLRLLADGLGLVAAALRLALATLLVAGLGLLLLWSPLIAWAEGAVADLADGRAFAAVLVGVVLSVLWLAWVVAVRLDGLWRLGAAARPSALAALAAGSRRAATHPLACVVTVLSVVGISLLLLAVPALLARTGTVSDAWLLALDLAVGALVAMLRVGLLTAFAPAAEGG